MPAFCPHCGSTPDEAGLGHAPDCPELSVTPVPTRRLDVLLPKADLARRFGGSGLELVTFFLLEMLGVLLSPFTLTISGMVTGLLAALYMSVKDLRGGGLSVGKQIARVALVDVHTGRLATTKQALLRNSYFIVGWLFAVLPDPFGMVGWALVLGGVLIDTLMIIADPRGRRIGDRIAGTQAVPLQEVR